jgi:hypothetical protein
MSIASKILDLFRQSEPAGAALEVGPAIVTIGRNSGEVAQPFVALQDFESLELRSVYCAGLKYNARVGDETLLAMLPQWKAEGKVSY